LGSKDLWYPSRGEKGRDMKGAFRNSLIMALAAIVMGCQEKPVHTPQGPRAKVPEIL
jgi:hypothetical protein